MVTAGPPSVAMVFEIALVAGSAGSARSVVQARRRRPRSAQPGRLRSRRRRALGGGLVVVSGCRRHRRAVGAASAWGGQCSRPAAGLSAAGACGDRACRRRLAADGVDIQRPAVRRSCPAEQARRGEDRAVARHRRSVHGCRNRVPPRSARSAADAFATVLRRIVDAQQRQDRSAFAALVAPPACANLVSGAGCQVGALANSSCAVRSSAAAPNPKIRIDIDRTIAANKKTKAGEHGRQVPLRGSVRRPLSYRERGED